MINNTQLTGGELIQLERERQVMEHNHTISKDATCYRSGELINMALALIYKNPGYAPPDWNPDQVKKLIDLPDADRLVVAGAFIAAQVDVLNYYTNMAELMQKHAANVPDPKIYKPESEN